MKITDREQSEVKMVVGRRESRRRGRGGGGGGEGGGGGVLGMLNGP